MKFDSLWRFVGKKRPGQTGSKDPQARAGRLRKRTRPRVEVLEDRVVPSSIPAPLVNLVKGQDITIAAGSGSNPLITDSSPSIAIDPINPQKMVAVFTNTTHTGANPVRVQAAFSINAGKTWTPVIFPGRLEFSPFILGGLDADPWANNQLPSPPPHPTVFYAQSTDGNVAIDRNENAYILLSEHSTDLLGANTSGEIVLLKFDFTGNDVPTLSASFATPTLGKKVYQWAAQDPALNPQLIIDNNLPATQTDPNNPTGPKVSYVDPTTNATQTDTNAGNIYVLWNTNDNAPTGANNSYNPNTIKVAVSADGGATFSTQVLLNSGGHGGLDRYSLPSAVLSQGSASGPTTFGLVPGGQLTGVWVDSRINNDGTPALPNLDSNTIADGGAGAFFQGSTNGSAGGTTVLDAIAAAGGGGGNAPQTTTFVTTISANNAQFKTSQWLDPTTGTLSTAADLNVQLSLVTPHANQMQISLTFKSSGGGGTHTVILINNAVDSMGAALKQGLPTDSTNIGVLFGNDNGSFRDVGTIFDDQAARSIVDPTDTAPYTADFRPELGSLSFVNGLTSKQLAGTWTLTITDFVNNGNATPIPPQFLRSWSLDFTTHMTPSFQTVAVTGLSANNTQYASNPLRGAPAAGNVQFGNTPFPTQPPAAPDTGIGPNPRVAQDNTLGSFSPFQGRLYLAYVGVGHGANNSDIYMVNSDDGGVTWTLPYLVNDDQSATSSFFTGNRSQFDPSVAVDPVTGTVVMSWYDARDDAANARVATMVAYSTDGAMQVPAIDPLTGVQATDPISSLLEDQADTSVQTYVNATATATDAITGKNVTLSPIPANESGANPGRDQNLGYGTNQGLAVFNGQVFPVWTGNLNVAGAGIFTLNATIPAGPRVVNGTLFPFPQTSLLGFGFPGLTLQTDLTSDMGPVTAPHNVTQLKADGTTIPLTYDNTTLPDGTLLADGFIVTFDRPVDPATFVPDQYDAATKTFTAGSVQVLFRGPSTQLNQPGISLFVTKVIPLDDTTFGPAGAPGATQFLVRFDPLQQIDMSNPNQLTVIPYTGTHVGTYSYAVGPDVRDHIRQSGYNVFPSINYPAVIASTGLPIPPDSPGATPPGTDTGGANSPHTQSKITLTGVTGPISHIDVNVNIVHTNDTDLVITLIAPNNTQFILSQNEGFGGQNFGINTTNLGSPTTYTAGTPTTFDDNALMALFAGAAPFVGSFMPDQSLLPLTGLSPNGTWTLDIQDQTANNVGVLVSWSLDIATKIPVDSPGNPNDPGGIGNPMDQNLNGIAGEPSNDVYATPRPLNQVPFHLPYDSNTLPLIVPGPHVVNTFVPGNNPTARYPASVPATGLPIPSDNPTTPGGTDTGGPTSLPTTSTITVAGVTGLITHIDVNVNIVHTNDADLVITLLDPIGNAFVLSQNEGGSGQNFGVNTVNSGTTTTYAAGAPTTFDDNATTAISQGTAPFVGRFLPEQMLALLSGQLPNGIWTLEILDTQANNFGALVSWSLDITTSTADNLVLNKTVSSIDAVFDRNMDPKSFAAASVVSMVGPTGLIPATLFTVTPDPNGDPKNPDPDPIHPRTYRISFPTQQLSGTYTIVFASTVKSQSGDLLDTNLNAGVDALRGTNPKNGSPNSLTTVNSQPVTIAPGPSMITSQINVISNFTVQDAFVNLTINYPLDSGLTAVLIAPDGTMATLFSGVGGMNANFVNTTLNDFANTPITSGLAPFTGIFIPQQSINNILRGKPSAGTYTLEIINNDPSMYLVPTQLVNWSLTLQQTLPDIQANNKPVAVPAGHTAISTITITNPFLVLDPSVLLNITAPNIDPFLSASLVAPDGTTIPLFTNLPNKGSNFTNTTFSDFATTPIQTTVVGGGPVPPYNGMFNPEKPLAVLDGKSSAGTYQLVVTNQSTTQAATILNWTLILNQAVTGAGLGEPIADQATLTFRIFTMDPTNPLSHDVWTAVGPAAENATAAGLNGANSGRIGGIAIDSSDPSGNTVYIAGASGGVWKTTNFLTTNPTGPIYIPLTDFGPTFGINIGGLAVFGQNNDPRQTVVIAGTGEGDTATQGEGFIRSLDGGSTWTLLDSTINVDASGNILPINSPSRDHIFVGDSTFKVVVDPNPKLINGKPNGVIIFAALSGPTGGIWRSLDSGNHWTRMSVGTGTTNITATDVVFAPASVDPTTFNLDIGFAAIQGQGVFMTENEGQSWFLLSGGGALGDIRDASVNPEQAIIAAPNQLTPNGVKGRITLAVPARNGNPLQDRLYENWVYAIVATAPAPGNGGDLDGLYLMKDAGTTGGNWTKILLPALNLRAFNANAPLTAIPNNDDTLPTFNVFGNQEFHQGNYDQSLAVDPNNPSVVYVGGTNDGTPAPAGGLLRVDTTGIFDSRSLVAFDYNQNDGGQVRNGTTGAVNLKDPTKFYGVFQQVFDPTTGMFLLTLPTTPPLLDVNGNTPFLNLLIDPYNPFAATSNASILVTGVRNVTQGAGFNNDGGDIFQWIGFETAVNASTDQHRVATMIDPLTGNTRIIFGDDQGVYSDLVLSDGTMSAGTGNTVGQGALTPAISRNGNLQIIQFYYGASQPSILAAQIAAANHAAEDTARQGGLFYGNAQDDGFPISPPDVLGTGDITWTGPEGDGTGIATDQTGSGSAYSYQWPCCGQLAVLSTINFLVVNPHGTGYVSRTGNGGGSLILAQNPGNTPDPEWPFLGGFYPAVNPVNEDDIVLGSGLGRLFLTHDQGATWSVVGYRTGDASATASNTFDGSVPRALAFGGMVTDSTLNPTGQRGSFLYAGTTVGNIFVTFDGATFKEFTTADGLDGTSVESISADPVPETFDAFAVTQQHVYFMPDVRAAGARWIDITSNLFTFSHNIFTPFNGGQQLTDKYLHDTAGNLTPTLTSIVADWRFGTLNYPSKAPGTNPPTLYVGGEAGVFRSKDLGQTWTVFPNVADGAPQTGGYLPMAQVTSLSLAVGNINPTTGKPEQATGPNVLLASTYGRGSFAIRLPADTALNKVEGPHVASFSLNSPVSTGVSSVTVVFSGIIDPATFTAQKVHAFTGPAGQSIPVLSVVDITTPPISGANPHNVWQINFATQSADGVYTMVIGPDISDYAGDQMDQNGNGINGEIPGDQFVGQFDINSNDNGRFIIGVYNDLLARTPATSAFISALAPLDTPRFNLLPGMAARIVTSIEARMDLIYNPSTGGGYYPRFLHRNASPGDVNSWLQALQQGVAPEQVVAAIVSSMEYFLSSAGGNDANFVAQIYLDLFARPVDAPSAQSFVNLLDQVERSARSTLAASVLFSPEYFSGLLYNPNTGTDPATAQGYYPQFLGRLPQGGEAQTYLNQLVGGASNESIISQIVGSDEYYVNRAPVIAGTSQSPQTFVTALFLQLLNRKPNQAELDSYSSSVAANNTPQGRAQVALQVMGLTEYRGLVVKSAYEQYLGRDPQGSALPSPTGEYATWVPFLAAGNSDEQLILRLVASDEFFNISAGSATALPDKDSNWVKALYQKALVRPVDATALTSDLAFLAQAEGSTRAQILQVLVNSNEYRTDLIYNANNNTGYYPAFLNRTASPGEISNWVNILSQPSAGPGQPSRDEQVLIDIVGSQEYFFDQFDPVETTTHSNRGWLSSLYLNAKLLGRTPDPAGLNSNLLALLNGYAAPRQQFTSSIVSSDEYLKDVVAGYYTKYLRRPASAGELAGWLTSMRGGETDEQVLQAVLSSGEYYTYALGNAAGSTGGQQFLNQLYADLLSRAPDPGAAGFLSFLGANPTAAQRSQVIGTLVGLAPGNRQAGTEYFADLVAGYYNTLLKRGKPIPANTNDPELSGWVQELIQGVTNETIINQLLNSEEYFLLPHP